MRDNLKRKSNSETTYKLANGDVPNRVSTIETFIKKYYYNY